MMPVFFKKINQHAYQATKVINRGKTTEILGIINKNLEISPSPDLKKPLSNYYIEQIKKEFRRDILNSKKNPL